MSFPKNRLTLVFFYFTLFLIKAKRKVISMKKNDFSDKLSPLELLLLLLLFVCYMGSLYFLITDNRSFLILFFVLHSCLSIIFVLIVHDRMARLVLEQTENTSQQLEEELQMISKYKKDITALKEERDVLLVDKEQLSTKCSAAEKQASDLADALKKEQEMHKQIHAEASLNHLLPQNEAPVNLNIIACAKDIIEEMLPYCRRSGIQLLLSSASDTLMVKADANFIRILFRNIIDNSIKYMNRNGSLVITISNIADDLFIVLKDNGEGLSPNETPHIFELNYQGSNRVSGNGLGLTQAKAIVEYYGGTIYAKSESGSGMGIYIQLPANSY